MQIDKTFNDFVLKFGNINGSGSASANLLCAKALFRMGLPVTPKNIFPSNIQGMPTWYEIRVSEAGFQARRDGIDVMVAMNPQTYRQDVKCVVPGGTLIYDSTMKRNFGRDDIDVLGNSDFQTLRRQLVRFRGNGNCLKMWSTSAHWRGLIDIDNEILETLIGGTVSAAKPKLVKTEYRGAGNWPRIFPGKLPQPAESARPEIHPHPRQDHDFR